MYKSSYDAYININPSLGTEILSGLNIFAGAVILQLKQMVVNGIEDAYEGVGGVTYDIGPFQLEHNGLENILGETT